MRGSLSHEPTLRAVRDLLHLDGPGYALPDALLAQLVDLLEGDEIMFNHVDSTAQTQYFIQHYAADAGSQVLIGTDWLEPGAWTDSWAHYWDSPCSFPERTGTYHHVQMLTDFYSDRQRRSDPITADCGPQIMLVLPNGQGRTLRLICNRESGRDFTEDDRFLLLLLMPHLERLFRARERQRAGTQVVLTPRQRQLLRQLRLGLTNAQIAHRLGISEGTVRSHLEHLYARLGVTNRMAAVIRAENLADEPPTSMRLQ
ncbi:MAG: helix-turn-helix transcriptional regulator [Ornithinimicrobium sp.]